MNKKVEDYLFSLHEGTFEGRVREYEIAKRFPDEREWRECVARAKFHGIKVIQSYRPQSHTLGDQRFLERKMLEREMRFR